ncbi:LysR family transcriptional regulator [Sphingobium boeckii]|uniref:DNA-binding transcriptional LysR family regulator n=1 Tax=Sphingobium boeckii TaxID=1082345 RepID=A0A7W9EF10_9SPHN|nr:LysR family transcriptional regulator [Sphingobium boeckii]MBB5686823.1 DNA-binding transcriptional LysR family regulator [Sphingobium boeckii]
MMDPDYDLFVTVVDMGGLSAAARRLGVSPAMVSKRLARLEQRLGTRLIHRSTRKMALTPQGERLRSDLGTIFEALRTAEDRVTGRIGEAAGPLRISAPTSFGRMHIAPHLETFLGLYPHVEVTLNLSDDFTDLFSPQVDLAIRITADVSPSLKAHRLATSQRVLCAAPAYLQTHGEPETLSALAKHRLLAASGQLPWKLVGPKGTRTVDGKSLVTTNSSEVVRELAISGAGVALRSLWDVGTELADGRLKRILSDHEGSTDVGIFAVYPAMTPTAAMAAFIGFLETLYAPSPPWAVTITPSTTVTGQGVSR